MLKFVISYYRFQDEVIFQSDAGPQEAITTQLKIRVSRLW